nr:hypothetical protein MarQu_419 [Marseillevirus sp.]
MGCFISPTSPLSNSEKEGTFPLLSKGKNDHWDDRFPPVICVLKTWERHPTSKIVKRTKKEKTLGEKHYFFDKICEGISSLWIGKVAPVFGTSIKNLEKVVLALK